MSKTERGRTEEDIRPWESLVEDGVSMVGSGAIDIEEIHAHDLHDGTDEELREEVRERLATDEKEDGRDDADGQTITDSTAIDWVALFDEFGFDTANAAGDIHVSTTKLAEAIRVSEQNIAGDARSHIKRAEENDLLARVLAQKAQGEGAMVAGYRLGGGA